MQTIKANISILIIKLLALIPLATLQTFGQWLGKLLYHRGHRSRWYQVTRTNIQLCFPELTERQQDSRVQESLEQTCQTLMETGIAWYQKPQKTLKLIQKIEGLEHMEAAVAANQGVIIMAPHLGNWEILNTYLASRFEMTAMYKPAKNKRIDQEIIRNRQKQGSHLASADRSGVKKVLTALKKKQVVGILPDQEPKKGAGLYVPFFNRPALTMQLISQLAKQTGAKVVCAYAKRLGKGEGFAICFSKPEDAIYSLVLTESLRALNKAIEQAVLQSPTQYQWEYKRFNSQPEHFTNPYLSNEKRP